jgi:PAS domain-containing protein
LVSQSNFELNSILADSVSDPFTISIRTSLSILLGSVNGTDGSPSPSTAASSSPTSSDRLSISASQSLAMSLSSTSIAIEGGKGGEGTIAMEEVSEKTSNERTNEKMKKEKYYTLLRGVESLNDYAIFTLTEEGFVSSWNSGAKSIKGYDAEEIIGKHFSVFYTPEAQKQKFPWLELSEATKKGLFEDEGLTLLSFRVIL